MRPVLAGIPPEENRGQSTLLILIILQFLPLVEPLWWLASMWNLARVMIVPAFLLSWVPSLGLGYLFLRRWGRFVAVSSGYAAMLAMAAYASLSSSTQIGGPMAPFRVMFLVWALAVLVLAAACAVDTSRLVRAPTTATGEAGLEAPEERAGVIGSIGETRTRRVIVAILVVGCLSAVLIVDFLASLSIGVALACTLGPTCI
jgi:hypothetical protein